MGLAEQYARIEEETAAFSRESGIGCPSGCGDCCTAIDFPVSPPEAEHVAEFLLDHPAILARFEAQEIPEGRGKTRCPLWDPDSAFHCTVYEARPLICRTFGFAAHRGKDALPVFTPCHRFRESEAGNARVEAIRAEMREGRGPKLPVMPDEGIAVWSLDPGWGADSAPMGPAVTRALAKLRYRRQLEG